MRIWRIFLFIVIVLTDGCIDPISVETHQRIAPLVVDGMITNAPGPYVVKIFYASGLGTTLRKPQPLQKATVTIVDDLGNSEVLIERGPGIYETSPNGIQGEIGRSYKLMFESKNGKKYESPFQKLNAPGSIDRLYTEFQKNVVIEQETGDSNPDQEYDDAFGLYVDAKGVSDESTLMRWRVTGVYEMKTFPERNREATPGGYIPDPLPCSGYIRVGLSIYQRSECTCCQCWLYEYSSASYLSDNENVQDISFNHVDLGKIPITRMRFYKRYYVQVEQLSLSEEAYNFWRLVKTQQNSSGNIFQPNAVKIRGNIKCVSDPEDEVLGIFSVSGVTTSSIFIEPTEIPYTLEPIDTLTVDCRDFAFSTPLKPLFW
jgi:hypothetical protein